MVAYIKFYDAVGYFSDIEVIKYAIYDTEMIDIEVLEALIMNGKTDLRVVIVNEQQFDKFFSNMFKLEMKLKETMDELESTKYLLSMYEKQKDN